MAGKKKLLGKRINPILVVAVIIVVFFFLFVLINPLKLGINNGNVATAERPKYCGSEGYCVPADVFSLLPAYPDGMSVVKTRIDTMMYNVMENFGAVNPLCRKWSPDYLQCLEFTPDKYFYKQPEFYYNEWTTENINTYYLPLGNPKGYNYSYLNVGGGGAFPGVVIIEPQEGALVKPGMDLRAVTYFHAALGVRNYQGVHLEIDYPDKAEVFYGVNTIKINQDPNTVKNYFDVTITPQEFVLEPTFPVFHQDWTEKVVFSIHINENTPAGTYVIWIEPGSVSGLNQTKWSNEYGLRYYNFAQGFRITPPPYQIFITVSQ